MDLVPTFVAPEKSETAAISLAFTFLTVFLFVCIAVQNGGSISGWKILATYIEIISQGLLLVCLPF